MARIDEVAASVVSLPATTMSSAKTRFVADAFRLVVPPEEKYIESEVAIEALEFVSYAVGGLGAAAQTPATGTRATSHVTIPLADSGGGQASAEQDIVLFGPEDVRGIDPTQIIRRYPAPGATTAEERMLVHVEFDRPELPWAFSAATVQEGLRPWLTLIVVERAAVRRHPATAGLPLIEVPVDELPDLARVSQWAHAQVPQSTVPLTTRMSPEFAKVNLSRLVSPRVLREDTDYVAAVVPTTDAGARGGRGVGGGTLGPAWTAGGDATVLLPVYDSWEFRTGPDGNFERIARRLEGIVAPYEVGRRFIDASEPGRPLTPLSDGEPGAKQVLRCALFSPTPPSPAQATAETASWPQEKTDELRAQLDLPAELEGERERPGAVPDLPVIGPRLYAKAHRAANTVVGADWFAELNLSPMHRIAAGLGTRVVQRDQEQLMQAAWAQLGEVEKANRAIALAQLAELVASRLHARLTSLETTRLVQVAAPLAPRVSLEAGTTLAAQVAASATPVVALSSAFRRAVRPTGPMLRHAAPAARLRVGEILGSGASLRDFTRTYANPDGIGALSPASIATLDAAMVAPALGVEVSRVTDVLVRASRVVGRGIGAVLADPSAWQAPRADFDPAASVATRWSESVLREATLPAVADIRQERVAPLVAELATAAATRALPTHDLLVTRAQTLNNDLISRWGAGVGPVIGGGRDPGRVNPGHVDPGRIEPGRIDPGRIDLGRIVVEGGGIDAGGIDATRIRRGAGRIDPGGIDVARIEPGHIDAGRIDAGRIEIGHREGGQVGGHLEAARAGQLRRLRGIEGGALQWSLLDVGSLIEVTAEATPARRTEALKKLAGLATVPVAPALESMTTVSADALRAVLPTLIDPGGVHAVPPVTRRDTVSVQQLAAAIDPRTTVRQSLRGRLHLAAHLVDRVFLPYRIRRIMAAPVFRRPMYEALEDYDKEWLVPGMGLLPATDFVTVLSTNSEFTEAFLVGLSDEMGRELLGRNYPTDQSGTYFRRFWDRDQDELPRQIHAFEKTALGRHYSTGGDGGSEPRAVIVVKSELVRRYPDLIIQAVKDQNHGGAGDPKFDGPGAVIARQLFAAYLAPDTALIGVDLTIPEIDRPEWWITIAEHPSATRFERPDDAATRGKKFIVGATASGADYAADRLHDPIRVAFHATDIVKRA